LDKSYQEYYSFLEKLAKLDRFILYKDKDKDNKQLSVDGWILLLFEYCQEQNVRPIYNTIYKNRNIGGWLGT
jgi:hypothetical protein